MSNDIDGAGTADALVRRGPIKRVPIQVTLTALLQDNGDGTWSASVPVLSLYVETGVGRHTTIKNLARRLSELFTRDVSA